MSALGAVIKLKIKKESTKGSGARIDLSNVSTPMSVAIGRNRDLEQELWSVIALGDHVSVGVIKAIRESNTGNAKKAAARTTLTISP